MTERRPEGSAVGLLERHPSEAYDDRGLMVRSATPMWDEVKRLMDEHGIEDVEDLHRRFVASSVRGLIPVSGRHSDKPVKLSEFCEHITGRYPVVYREVIQGLFEIFEINRQSAEAARFVLSYMWGRPDGGVHPKTPLP